MGPSKDPSGAKGQSPKSVPRAKDKVKVQSHTSSGHQYLGFHEFTQLSQSFTCPISWNIFNSGLDISMIVSMVF